MKGKAIAVFERRRECRTRVMRIQYLALMIDHRLFER